MSPAYPFQQLYPFQEILNDRLSLQIFFQPLKRPLRHDLRHYAFVLHHGAAEVIADDKVQLGIVYDIQLLLRGVHMDYGISGGMECGYGAWYPQGAKQGVNVFP